MTNSQISNSSGPQNSNDMKMPHRNECKLIANLDFIKNKEKIQVFVTLFGQI